MGVGTATPGKVIEGVERLLAGTDPETLDTDPDRHDPNTEDDTLTDRVTGEELPEIYQYGRLARRCTEILRACVPDAVDGDSEDNVHVHVHRLNAGPSAIHIHSTMRMGYVADENCEAYDVDQLFIADHSVLPNGLGGPNPTKTGQALAMRTRDRIADLYFSD